MSQIHVGCEFEYATTGETSFLFNVNVSQTDFQRVLSENLTITPAVFAERLEIGLERKISQRCFVQSGGICLRYDATVELSAEVDFGTTLVEHSYSELPPEVLPYLNPSRYCE